MEVILDQLGAERLSEAKDAKDSEEYRLIMGNTAFLIAQMAANVSLTTSPRKIVLGGRVSTMPLFIGYFREAYQYFLQVGDGPAIYPDYPELRNIYSFVELQIDLDCGVLGGLRLIIEKLDTLTGDPKVAFFLTQRNK